MYASKVSRQLVAVLKEDPDLKSKGAFTATQLRHVAERLILEMWQRGFTVAARQPGSKSPKQAGEHREWREAKLAQKQKPRQTDVEASPKAAIEGSPQP